MTTKNPNIDIPQTPPPWERPEVVRLAKPIPQTTRETILNEAALAVSGDRAINYGLPEDNHKRIATLWNAYVLIRKQTEPGVGITPYEVSIFNILTKIARLANNPNHKDSWVDIAGYAACGAEVSGAE